MPSRRSLSSLIFAALKRAGEENRLDVAEHLLRALEALESPKADVTHFRATVKLH